MPAADPPTSDPHLLAQAIFDTVRDPLLVLDEHLRVVAASRSFYQKFGVEPAAVEGRLLGELDDRQFEIAPLRALLERVAPDRTVMEDYELVLTVKDAGTRTLLLNARKVFYAETQSANILLALEDITERRAVEDQRDHLLRQKDLLLQEMKHRVANSLSIIASILMLKAQTVPSPETRAHLEDARRRVLSVAAVQRHLHPTEVGRPVDMQHYLVELCASLNGSVTNEDDCKVQVVATTGTASSGDAVSLGLIATELVINALKHAFPEQRPGCTIDVRYEVNGPDWRLSVADNGIGKQDALRSTARVGLGTSIVNALAEQLDAKVATDSSASGTTVSITHSTFRPAPA